MLLPYLLAAYDIVTVVRVTTADGPVVEHIIVAFFADVEHLIDIGVTPIMEAKRLWDESGPILTYLAH